jgi:hypothetical protein
MTRHIYDIGTQVKLEATFEDPVKEETVKPNTVVCTVLTGDRQTLTPEVKESGGVYSASIDITVSGYHHYAFDGTGTYKASKEKTFEVNEQQVPR